MCGIAGIYQGNKVAVGAETQHNLMRRMTDRIAHRGPDQSGVWVDRRGRCALGHRRLSIIDLSDAGQQPMGWGADEWIISFNGEIYNFLELKKELEDRGARFSGRTDTEVLLAGLSIYGVDCLKRLDGMFAFAAFHVPSGRIIIARDAFGEKPLYYMPLKGGGIAFASELQCFEDVPGFSNEVCQDALAELLMFQYIGAPRTILRDVFKLPPGCWMEIQPDGTTFTGSYFKFQPHQAEKSTRSKSDLADELEDILLRSLRRRLVSDVPVGAFLSGGVDSSTVCALITKKLNVPIKTFSIGFVADSASEHLIARRIAQHLGTEHLDRMIKPSAVGFLNDVGNILDEPNADSSCLPTYFLAQFAREHVTVAISGDGGDELFGGYGRYFDTLREAEKYTSSLNGYWSPGGSYYLSNRILNFNPMQLAEFFGGVPIGAANHIRDLIKSIDSEAANLLDALRASDAQNYMPGAVLSKVDRMSMQHSLEVRTPFLNIEMARFAEQIPTEYLVNKNGGKQLLREIAYRYIPREIVDLPKKGFGLPLSKSWGRPELLDSLRNALGPNSFLAQLIGADRAQNFCELQMSKNGFSIYQTWSVVLLEKWIEARGVQMPASVADDSVSLQELSSQFFVGNNGQKRIVGRISSSTVVVSSPTTIEMDETKSIRAHLSLFDRFMLKSLSSDIGVDFNDCDAYNDSTSVSSIFEIDAFSEIAKNLSDLGMDLNNTVLIILDEVCGMIDHDDIMKLRSMGVSRLVVRDRLDHSEGFVEYTFQNFQMVRRIFNLVALLPHIAAVWLPLRRRYVSKRSLCFGPVRSLPDDADRELCVDFALFDGPVQYLPFVSSHVEVHSSLQRRYSIWNSHVIYSKPSLEASFMGRVFCRFNWVVPITERTVPYLPMVSKKVGGNAEGDSFFSAIRHLVDKKNESVPPNHFDDLIVLYTHGLSPGGAERQWCNLAIGFAELGQKVCVVVDSLEGSNNHYSTLLEQSNIELIDLESSNVGSIEECHIDDELLPLFSGLTSPVGAKILRFFHLLSQLKPKTVIAQLDATNIVGAIAALLVDVPRVFISFRNYNPSNFDYINQWWLLPAYRELVRSNRITLTGNSLAGNIDYANWIGIDAADVVLLPNSLLDGGEVVSRREPQAEFLADLGVSPNSKIILGVFRLSVEKNPLLFVDVCAEVLRHNPEAVVVICGEGPLRPQVELKIAEYGLGDKILLQGRRSNIQDYFGVANVLLHTSDFEGAPNVIREAFAARCPVVATAVGAVPEMVEHGVTGFIVPVGDRRALSEAVSDLIGDSCLRKRMVDEISKRPYGISHREVAQQVLSLVNL